MEGGVPPPILPVRAVVSAVQRGQLQGHGSRILEERTAGLAPDTRSEGPGPSVRRLPLPAFGPSWPRTKMSRHTVNASLRETPFKTYSHFTLSRKGLPVLLQGQKSPGEISHTRHRATVYPSHRPTSHNNRILQKWDGRNRFSKNPWSLLTPNSIFSFLNVRQFMGVVQ